MVLEDLEATCTARFHARWKNNVELNCFPVLTSYCCDVFDVKNVTRIRYGLSVRRAPVRCLRKMEDRRKQRCTRTRAMADTSQATARKEDLMSPLFFSGKNVMIEKQSLPMRLSEEALRNISLSGWPFLRKACRLFRMTY